MALVPLLPPGYKAHGQLYRAQAVLTRKSGEELDFFPSRSGIWNERFSPTSMFTAPLLGLIGTGQSHGILLELQMVLEF